MSRRAAPKANPGVRSTQGGPEGRRAAPKANPGVRSTQDCAESRLLIAAQSVAPQAWRNGGGQTRELLAWPRQGPWQLRISRADIGADGPFSAFPGVTRWFSVLEGRGVALTFQGKRHLVDATGDALCFDGAWAPDCTLLDGPTQDLNLMAIGGVSVLRKVAAGDPWDDGFRMRGLYTTTAGHWHGPQDACAVQAHSLLWEPASVPGAWTFTPSCHTHPASGSAWWLGFTPED